MKNKIINVLTNKKFDIFINTLVICPLLYIIDYDWEKYNIIALILAVFIVIKNLLLAKINYNFNKSKSEINKSNKSFFKKVGITTLYKFCKIIIEIVFFCFQYKYKTIAKYNVWVCGLIYFNYLINFSKKYFKKSFINKIKKNKTNSS